MSDIERPADDSDAAGARLPARKLPRAARNGPQPLPPPAPPPRSRAVRHPLVVFLNLMLTVVFIVVVGLGAAVFIGKSHFQRPGAMDRALPFTVPSGAGLDEIADGLARAGAIASKWIFIAGVWLNREHGNLKAGEFLIPAHASMEQIMRSMVEGRGILYSILIPEGFTSHQIVERLRADEVLIGDVAEIPPEGSLLPETYKFSRGDTRQNLLARMQRDRDSLVTEVWSRRSPDLPLSNIDEFVTMASIVEKETALDEERSRVAAVFINRLRRGMPLQADPTVIYGLFGGEGPPPGFQLSRTDLQSATPYNTYVNSGLPPGPIANPGEAALVAVANPSRTSDLYFVADGTGGHAFAETYEDHLRNVARWREINDALTADPPSEAEPEPEGEKTDIPVEPTPRPER